MLKAQDRVSDAALCRSRGWNVGDVLVSEQTERSYSDLGEQVARITAIGEEAILVRVLTGLRKGKEIRWSRQLLSYAIRKAE